MLYYSGLEIPKKIGDMGFNPFLKRPFLPNELSAAMLNAITHKTPGIIAKGTGKPLKQHEARQIRFDILSL